MFGKDHIIAFDETCTLVKCVQCGFKNRVEGTTIAGLNAWAAGKLIQEVFPMVDSVGRELLISGICGRCWDKMMGGD